MEAKSINDTLINLTRRVDAGEFSEAFSGSVDLLKEIELISNKELRDRFLFNISGLFIDIGGMAGNERSSEMGLNLIEENKSAFMAISGEAEYYYNLSNAKTNLIKESNPFNHTFESIEQLIEIKSLLWKSVKTHRKNGEPTPPQTLVNLANILKRQFRLSESLYFYDRVNQLSLDIPQAWINRSETLKILNQVSGSFSLQMMHEIKAGYERVTSSREIPPLWREQYQRYVEHLEEKIVETCAEADVEILDRETEDHETRKEFDSLSDFRKMVLIKHLSLSEHGLYCACSGSARDNLTIPTGSGVNGSFVPAMEMVLNRLKSEFSLARRFYYEYLHEKTDEESMHESCYSELFNDELLGLNIEKLRTAFRLCFGILDKIAAAICDLYDVPPSNGSIYFQGFWQLDQGGRREIFEKIKTPGLLALYSLATDLNERKDGELAFFKQWRNDLEHKFVVIHEQQIPNDLYGSHKMNNKVIMISEMEFIEHLEQLLQITRSAIFSFVFCVREKGNQESNPDELYIQNIIHRKDYI
ncbi:MULTISPECIES: LA2681 family HEPN domain-containing protein [unclassified Pseudomonas]|uniref:LA2681 family HEPN domain-containing protein n=1 Tax=unclassified Pseudomonas TaxID=196821 RepID=UPI002AC9A6B8|nr:MULTISPECIES: LA2681 family HEPN domain-containing protein [unclassified Pseudomonas]MEB0044116.1 LA2681 family HEPN domain-containing protein [Pseudomonas sp. Dout3]MEB0094947.1 LA2681 family HEPN domain-containing protein [Pseudomonas sp. DC1.2]WPX59694.1 LA2681 family HEPN domain-containing protein [Pseudomonas sp. DC1.2]